MTTLFILLALWLLLGLWTLVNPQQYILWLKEARPSLGLREDDPRPVAIVRFIGGIFIAVAVVVFVSFLGHPLRR